jgi:hypothetical protein
MSLPESPSKQQTAASSECRTRHTLIVAAWLISIFVLGAAMLVTARAFEWHRYSRGHFTAQFAVRGRGFFLCRTPDGTWWKLRVGRRDCGSVYPSDWGEQPPNSGVREPRSPLPSTPTATVELDLPL